MFSGETTGRRVCRRMIFTCAIAAMRRVARAGRRPAGEARAEPPRREHERIAAGQNDFPYLGMGRDVPERGVELSRRERPLPRPAHFLAQAETAIARAAHEALL